MSGWEWALLAMGAVWGFVLCLTTAGISIYKEAKREGRRQAYKAMSESIDRGEIVVRRRAVR